METKNTCKGCKHLHKKYNACLNSKCFKNGRAQILKHTEKDHFPLEICLKNKYYEKGTTPLNSDDKRGRYSKYNAKKTVVDNIKFDSKSEANRYCELKLLEKSGQIKNLKLQPKFPLHLDDKNRFYIADFQYFEVKTGKDVVEDVKGVKTPVYKLKKARFLNLYPQYDFREIK